LPEARAAIDRDQGIAKNSNSTLIQVNVQAGLEGIALASSAFRAGAAGLWAHPDPAGWLISTTRFAGIG